LRSILFGLLAQVIALVTSMLVVAGYAFYLAWHARGKPDQTLINQFAALSSRWVMAGTGIIVTFLLASYIARQAPRQSVEWGLVVGVSSAVVATMVAFLFRAHLGIGSALVPLLLVLASWLGARSGLSRTPSQRTV
jgi:hypothetical protein